MTEPEVPDWGFPYPNDDVGNQPAEDAGPHAWVVHGLKLLSNEMRCVIGHLERAIREEGENGFSDLISAAMHMSNVAQGVGETARVIFEELLTDEEKINVTLQLAQERLGIPLRAMVVDMGEGRNIVAFQAEPVIVPDTLDEMMKEGE